MVTQITCGGSSVIANLVSWITSLQELMSTSAFSLVDEAVGNLNEFRSIVI